MRQAKQKGKSKRQRRQRDFEEHFTVAYDKRLRSSILSELAIYYRANLFCDVAIYCPASQGDDLSSQHAVQQDVWLTPGNLFWKIARPSYHVYCLTCQARTIEQTFVVI